MEWIMMIKIMHDLFNEIKSQHVWNVKIKTLMSFREGFLSSLDPAQLLQKATWSFQLQTPKQNKKDNWVTVAIKMHPLSANVLSQNCE